MIFQSLFCIYTVPDLLCVSLMPSQCCSPSRQPLWAVLALSDHTSCLQHFSLSSLHSCFIQIFPSMHLFSAASHFPSDCVLHWKASSISPPSCIVHLQSLFWKVDLQLSHKKCPLSNQCIIKDVHTVLPSTCS